MNPIQNVSAVSNASDSYNSVSQKHIKHLHEYIYEVCPKSLWTILSKVLDMHISLKAYAFHKEQRQLNLCSQFYEKYYSCFGVALLKGDVG